MTLVQITEYLKNKITNWYENASIDYGITGEFVHAFETGDKNQHLIIVSREDGELNACEVSWYKEYKPEQIYNIWIEG